METVILICCVLIIVLLILVLIKVCKPDNTVRTDIMNAVENLSKNRESDNRMLMDQLSRQEKPIVDQLDRLGRDLKEAQDKSRQASENSLKRLDEQMSKLIDKNSEGLKEITGIVNDKMESKLNGFSQTVGTNITNLGKTLNDNQKAMTDSFNALKAENGKALADINDTVNVKLDDKLNRSFETMTTGMTALGKNLSDSQSKQEQTTKNELEKLRTSFGEIKDEMTAALTRIRNANTEDMEKMRLENQKSLDKINDTVNEKLQKTLDDKISQSFEAVNSRLKEVYEGLGEMKSVAVGVTDLKKVLSNVKTRGNLGEIQLEAILEEILAPEQYGRQVQLSSGGRERVDFAVRLPGSGDSEVYLPIDSKFPGDTYSNLQDAYDSGDTEIIKKARGTLKSEILRCAKDISDKYIIPPETTDFAVMFLPFEGLYAEVVNMGLIEQLQREHRVNIAGPSTMAAMLNSFRMGFKTLAIQKKSGEVWKILGAAKTEFENFDTVLKAVQKKLQGADSDLEKLVGARTRKINRALQNVENLDSGEAEKMLTDDLADD